MRDRPFRRCHTKLERSSAKSQFGKCDGISVTKTITGSDSERKLGLSKEVGAILRDHFADGIAGRNSVGHKPACYECGNTGRHKGNCAIWKEQVGKWNKCGTDNKGDGGENAKGRSGKM